MLGLSFSPTLRQEVYCQGATISRVVILGIGMTSPEPCASRSLQIPNTACATRSSGMNSHGRTGHSGGSRQSRVRAFRTPDQWIFHSASRAAKTILRIPTPGGLIGYLRRCRAAFGAGSVLDLRPLAVRAAGIRSNAGFTKIYALVFDDFVIYDSRVAAALGMLVVRWWARKSPTIKRRSLIPPPLQFCHLPAMGEANRDPNTNALHISGFPRCTSQLQHLRSNIRANWLLTRALRGTHFEAQIRARFAHLPVHPLRALEGALFMIGYDLGTDWSPLA